MVTHTQSGPFPVCTVWLSWDQLLSGMMAVSCGELVLQCYSDGHKALRFCVGWDKL